MAEFKLPTETILLPSKGLLYSEDSPLAKGEVEMKYMTAKEEDILTNQNYISNGTVIDKLLQSLIVTKDINYNELLIGDKNAIMVAARVLSYGKDYEIFYGNESVNVDLTQLKEKEVDYNLFKDRTNSFSFTLPKANLPITFKLLSHADEKAIDKEIQGLKKIDKQSSTLITTRLKHTITSVNGNTDKKEIREFVDKYLLAADARALREEITKILPDVEMKFYPEDGPEGGVDIPVGVGFFWPEL